jgi:hypothetical protein
MGFLRGQTDEASHVGLITCTPPTTDIVVISVPTSAPEAPTQATSRRYDAHPRFRRFANLVVRIAEFDLSLNRPRSR